MTCAWRLSYDEGSPGCGTERDPAFLHPVSPIPEGIDGVTHVGSAGTMAAASRLSGMVQGIDRLQAHAFLAHHAVRLPGTVARIREYLTGSAHGRPGRASATGATL